MAIKFFALCCLVSSASASFFPFLQPVQGNGSASNLCIYSADPSQYEPKCFLCPNTVYPQAIQACLNGSTSIPNNITFLQANCMEKNCAINYPQPSQSPSKFGSLFDIFKNKFYKRSVDEPEENSLEHPVTNEKKLLLQLFQQSLSDINLKNIEITQQINTFATDDVLYEHDY